MQLNALLTTLHYLQSLCVPWHEQRTCYTDLHLCLKGHYDVTEDCVMHHNMTTLNGRCLLRSIPRLVYPRKALIHGYSLRSSTVHPKSSFSFVTLLGPLTKRGVPPARPLGVRNFTFRLGKWLAGCASSVRHLLY